MVRQRLKKVPLLRPEPPGGRLWICGPCSKVEGRRAVRARNFRRCICSLCSICHAAERYVLGLQVFTSQKRLLCHAARCRCNLDLPSSPANASLTSPVIQTPDATPGRDPPSPPGNTPIPDVDSDDPPIDMFGTWGGGGGPECGPRLRLNHSDKLVLQLWAVRYSHSCVCLRRCS